MERPKVLLSWSLYVECPKCEHDFDLTDLDDNDILAAYIFNNDWTLVEGYEVTCPKCGHEFELGEVEY